MRAFEPGDAEAFHALNSHPDVMRYTDDVVSESVEKARAAIEAYPDFDRHGFGRWACIYKPEGRLIGFAGLKRLDDLQEVDLGYRFLPEYWGRGLATEASLASVAFGFETLQLERIIGLVLKENRASIRVLEKVGMSFEREIEYQGVRVLQYAVGRSG